MGIKKTYSIDGTPCTQEEFNNRKAYQVATLGLVYQKEVFNKETRETNSDLLSPEGIIRTVCEKEITHKERHVILHEHLDELIADWIMHMPKASIEKNSIYDLMVWSNEQTLNPTEVPNEGG